MTNKLYKDKYVISFYESDDDTLKYVFDNLREVCIELGLEVNHKNMNRIQVDIFRSVRRPNHQTNLFRGQCLRVYLTDITQDYDKDE